MSACMNAAFSKTDKTKLSCTNAQQSIYQHVLSNGGTVQEQVDAQAFRSNISADDYLPSHADISISYYGILSVHSSRIMLGQLCQTATQVCEEFLCNNKPCCDIMELNYLLGLWCTVH